MPTSDDHDSSCQPTQPHCFVHKPQGKLFHFAPMDDHIQSKRKFVDFLETDDVRDIPWRLHIRSMPPTYLTVGMFLQIGGGASGHDRINEMMHRGSGRLAFSLEALRQFDPGLAARCAGRPAIHARAHLPASVRIAHGQPHKWERAPNTLAWAHVCGLT
jgi:hypothetical protein